jgi:hypothetical protein
VDANAAIALRTIRVRVSIAFNRLPQSWRKVTEVVIAARDAEVTPRPRAAVAERRNRQVAPVVSWRRLSGHPILAGVVRVQSELCLSLGSSRWSGLCHDGPMRGKFLTGASGTSADLEYEITDVDLPDRLDGAHR